MAIRILPAAVEDAAAIAEVHVASSRSTYSGILPPETLERFSVAERTARWTKWLSDGEAGWSCFVAIDDSSNMVGFVCGGRARSESLQADGELYAIYLRAEAQRRGIGRALARRMAEALQSAGFRSMGLWVLEANPACRFYEAMGGSQVAEQEIERDGVRLKELGYRWDLRKGALGGGR